MISVELVLKVKNDHRSEFSNLSNWKEEAWKKSGLQLENLLRWSFFTFIYNRSSNMNYFIYFTSELVFFYNQTE